jgi:hypothetical protein
MKKIKYAFLLAALAVSPFAMAESVTGSLTGSALVQAVSLGVASQGSVTVGLGQQGASTATVGVTSAVTEASITPATLTPIATLTGGTTTATAVGPGSSSSFTSTGSASAFTVVPVINGTEAVSTLTLQKGYEVVVVAN